MADVDARVCADDGAGGVKVSGVAGERSQLRAAARRLAGLVQDQRAQGCDLVAADDDRFRVFACDGFGLRSCEACRALRGRLVCDVVLRNRRRDDVEGQRQTRQQRAPIGEVEASSKVRMGRESGTRNKGLDAKPF